MKGKILLSLGFLSTIVLPIFPIHAVADTPSQTFPSKVLITEIKLGGDSYSQGTDQPKDPQEFITLYNQTSSEIDLSGWVIEYAKSTFDKTYCDSGNWISHSVSSSVNQTVLNGTLKPGQASTPIARALTDNASGSLHLVNLSDKNNPTVQDLVGWGTSAPCFESASTTIPSNGKSIKRYLDCNNLPINTTNNTLDFAVNQPPSPGTLNNPYLNACHTEDTPAATESTTAATCEGIIISEILPNPAGADTNNEFIELYNPTSGAISLQGCSLQTTGSSKPYNLTNASLQPGEYHAFYNNETNLTLPNAAGGTVWLLSPSTELQAVTYQANLDDDVAWAYANNNWQSTYQTTPNAGNIIINVKPCPEGEERNLDTGYCNSTAALTTSSLSACKENQERNPETNRCRAITTAASSTKSPAAKSSTSTLTPCKEGQERNPATNRCKSIVTTASAELKSCPAGQERNPSTNRCRKATSGTTAKLSDVADIATGSMANNPHWWLAGFAAFSATGYGVYEWRQEAWQKLSKLKNILPGISAK
jgi:hypothetical protein